MLFRTLKRLVERNGLTDDLREKIDTLFALGRLTEDQYRELVGNSAA
ncbi:hypothetical protein ACTQZS_15220 [Bilifractor sp. LCP19S3_H10]